MPLSLCLSWHSFSSKRPTGKEAVSDAASSPDRPKSSALEVVVGSFLEGAEPSAVLAVESFFFMWPAEDDFLVPSADRLLVGGAP